jgi:hypothetical protein
MIPRHQQLPARKKQVMQTVWVRPHDSRYRLALQWI